MGFNVIMAIFSGYANYVIFLYTDSNTCLGLSFASTQWCISVQLVVYLQEGIQNSLSRATVRVNVF